MPTRDELIEKKKQKIEEEKKKLRELERKDRQKQRKIETRQKIIVGGLMIERAKKKEDTRKALISALETSVNRERDKETIQPLIDELKAIDSGKKSSGGSNTPAQHKPSA